MNLEFLNPEYFILLAIIPLIILWNYLNRDKFNNSRLNFLIQKPLKIQVIFIQN